MKLGIILIGLFCFSLSYGNQEKDKLARDMVEKIILSIKINGLESVLADINNANSIYQSNDFTVFCIDFEGNTLANSTFEAYRGKNVLEIQDPKGRYFVKEYIQIAKEKGEGFLEYQFMLPNKKKVGPKRCFVKRVPEKNVLIGYSYGLK